MPHSSRRGRALATRTRHIAFGSGIHFCLGQYLARLEGEEVFKALATRVPDLGPVTDTVEYARVRGVRSVLSLPVRGQVR